MSGEKIIHIVLSSLSAILFSIIIMIVIGVYCGCCQEIRADQIKCVNIFRESQGLDTIQGGNCE